MSFTTVIGIQPPVDREVRIGCPQLETPAAGWDMLRETLWLPHPFWIPRGSVREGPVPERGTFIVQDSRVVDWKAGKPVVEITSLGIAQMDGKDYKLECSAGLAEDLSLAVAPSPTIWRIGYPRVTKLWVSMTTPALFAHIGIAIVPPDTFGLPANPWGMAWVAPDNWVASGWVGESRTPSQLAGSKACLVTDTYLYDPGYADRDSIPNGIITL